MRLSHIKSTFSYYLSLVIQIPPYGLSSHIGTSPSLNKNRSISFGKVEIPLRKTLKSKNYSKLEILAKGMSLSR
jgi:hypothetical protein